MHDTLVLDPAAATVVRRFGLTDRGRFRSTNEDRLLIAEVIYPPAIRQTCDISSGHLFAVADGMGGHKAGEVASEIVIRAIEDYIPQLQRSPIDEAAVLFVLQEAVRQANACLFAEAAHRPELAGMGTTLTLAFTAGWRLFVVHVGDSRCYLCRGGRLQQLTRDHTVAADLARRRLIRPQDVASNRYRHVLTNALGGDRQLVEMDLQRHDLEPGDALLLCSDGLIDMVGDDEIAATLEASEPKQACERLVAEANRHGGRDNITAIVAHFEQA